MHNIPSFLDLYQFCGMKIVVYDWFCNLIVILFRCKTVQCDSVLLALLTKGYM